MSGIILQFPKCRPGESASDAWLYAKHLQARTKGGDHEELIQPHGKKIAERSARSAVHRTLRLCDVGDFRIVGTARTISAQLAELAERAAGIVPSVLL